MIKKIRKAQITTILVFIMAVLFLFALMSINLSRIAQKKTAISNITDSVGLRLASQLGSMANALKHYWEIYGDDLINRNFNWKLVAGGILEAVAIGLFVGGFFLLGATWPLAAKVGLVGLTLIAPGVSQQIINSNLGAQEALGSKFKSLGAYQQIVETPVYGALSGLVDDPALVKDKLDLDRDNDTEDYIPRFFKWYISRLNSFAHLNLNLSRLVEDFHKNFFGNERFNIREDPDTQMVLKRKNGEDPERPPDSQGWWVDWQVDYMGNKVKLVSWFHNDLRSMLSQMRNHGYGINARRDKEGNITIDDAGLRYEQYGEIIDTWINELEEFENTVARDMQDIDLDTLVQGVDGWLSYLTSADKGNWYYRLTTLEIYALELRNKLEERARGTKPAINYDSIHQCIEPCQRNAPGCCGGEEQWDCCSWSSCELRQPGRTKNYLLAYNNDGFSSVYDSGGGILPSNGRWILAQDGGEGGKVTDDGGDDGGEECVPTCLQNYGCCGALIKCGGLCNSDHCLPKYTCHPPLGPPRWCCDVLPLESPSDCATNSNIVDRYLAIQVLDKFIADVEKLLDLIALFYNKVSTINEDTYNKMHEAFYLWRDYVGGASSEKREVTHIVYVKIEGIDPKNGFALPRIKHFGNWNTLQTGVEVLNAKGEFTLTVARFDQEDTSKKGPLEKFWRFRFGRPGIHPSYEKILRDEAERFTTLIAQDKYAEVSSEYNKLALIEILRKYGIVTKIKVHYGPGYTPKEGETVSAAEKNKDIYIIKTSSNIDEPM